MSTQILNIVSLQQEIKSYDSLQSAIQKANSIQNNGVSKKPTLDDTLYSRCGYSLNPKTKYLHCSNCRSSYQ